MTISNELIQHLLFGAGIASLIFYRLGWLKFPSQAVVQAPVQAGVLDPNAPSYKSVIQTPFEVAITPQHQVKS